MNLLACVKYCIVWFFELLKACEIFFNNVTRKMTPAKQEVAAYLIWKMCYSVVPACRCVVEYVCTWLDAASGVQHEWLQHDSPWRQASFESGTYIHAHAQLSWPNNVICRHGHGTRSNCHVTYRLSFIACEHTALLVVTRVPFEQTTVAILSFSGVGACWGVQFFLMLMLGEVQSDVSVSLRGREFERDKGLRER